jgi:L-asparaginase II
VVGRVVARAGDAARVTYARSAVKPVQALPLVEDGGIERFGITEAELALCCASHNGEPEHVETALALLGRLGLGEEALACGPASPMRAETARALLRRGEAPRRVHNNCSGKHAGMLALARLHGWTPEGYERPDHPVQQRILSTVAAWAGVQPGTVGIGVDGCGVPTFALPLSALARSFARLGAVAAAEPESAAARITGAMTRHPEYVAGTGRLCTRLMRAAEGRVVVKLGAEGVYCAAVPGRGLGLALKAEDGAGRAAEPVLLAVLLQLGAIDAGVVERLREFAEPELRNTRDEVVGRIRAVVELDGAGG